MNSYIIINSYMIWIKYSIEKLFFFSYTLYKQQYYLNY